MNDQVNTEVVEQPAVQLEPQTQTTETPVEETKEESQERTPF